MAGELRLGGVGVEHPMGVEVGWFAARHHQQRCHHLQELTMPSPPGPLGAHGIHDSEYASVSCFRSQTCSRAPSIPLLPFPLPATNLS